MPMNPTLKVPQLFAIAAALLIAVPGQPQPADSWVGSWASSQYVPETENALTPDDLRDATLRQIVHVSIGGNTVRVHFSNAFSAAPLHLASVHVAHPVSNSKAAIDPATDKPLTFAGVPGVTIPPGADYISDPLPYSFKAGADLAISIHFDDPPQQQTGHPASRATSYLAHGDLVAAPDLPNARKIEHWYQLSAIDVTAPAAFSIVAFGDSITDGHGSTTNGNDRWPDLLARRLQAGGLRNVGVLNQGIGGNHLLTDGIGPNALARFDRDVLAQTAVRDLIVLEGINDLGALARKNGVTSADHTALVQRIIAAYQQIILSAHAHSIRVFGGTMTPYVGSDYYHPDAASEADRQAVNAWIRAPGHFDAVIDFDKAARDPAHPDRLLPAFDCGDHLHPSPSGYAAMAAAIPLSIFDSR
jgi:lysophospholipase L1-like esterase